MQLDESIIPNDFYVNYYMADENIDDTQNGRFNKDLLEYFENNIRVLSKYALKHHKIIDIGCGCGTLMNCENEFFDKVVGIEPSKKECMVAKMNGHNVINDYFGSELKLLDKFSAFVSIHVFEHLTNLRETLSYANEILEIGGVGYIDVPNGQRIYNEKEYYNIFGEHLNYFTPSSLCKLVSDCGFETINISEGWNGNHLAAFVRKPLKCFLSFNNRIEKEVGEINSIVKNYNSIGIWGMGNKAVNIVDLLNDKSIITYMFDSSDVKTGMYLDDLDIRIIKPMKNEVNKCNLIIISAVAYTEEIIADLKTSIIHSN